MSCAGPVIDRVELNGVVKAQSEGDSMSGVVLGVDVGGTKVDAALVDLDGQVVPGSHRRLPTGREITRDHLAERVRQVAAGALDTLAQHVRLLGVGIGSAGPIESNAALIHPVNMPRARGADLPAALRSLAPDLPIRLALDGACLALAEHRFGALRGARSGMAIVVSTGVGGGLVADGRVLTGVSGNAGHIGQLRLRPPGDGDPHDGTVEGMASGPRTVRWAREHGWEGASGEALARSYAAGDPVAVAAVHRSAAAIGQAIAATSTLLDLEAVVIAGGFSNVADDYLDLVRGQLDASVVLDYASAVRLRRSPLGGWAPLVGAAALVMDPDR